MRVARSLSLLSNSTFTRQKLRLQPFAVQQSQYTHKRNYCVCAVRLAAMGTSLKAGCGALAFLLSTDVVRAIRSVENVQELAAQAAAAIETYPSSTGRQLLQYNNGYYYNDNDNYWGGGRIAGVVIGCVAFVFAIIFCILAMVMRRRRMARYQNNGGYPVNTSGAMYPNQGLQGPTGTYPQANTYNNQAYPPQNTGGYNPAVAGGYPATGVPANEQGYNGVQMQPLAQEKPGYQTSV